MTHKHLVYPPTVVWLTYPTFTVETVPPRICDTSILLVAKKTLGVMVSLNECLTDADTSWLGLVIQSTWTVEDPVSWEMDWWFAGGSLRSRHDASDWSKSYTIKKVLQRQHTDYRTTRPDASRSARAFVNMVHTSRIALRQYAILRLSRYAPVDVLPDVTEQLEVQAVHKVEQVEILSGFRW